MSKKLDTRAIGIKERKFLENLKKEIFGQDEVLVKIADAVGIHQSPLRDLNKPIGVFLSVGPPGVGKMAVVRALARHLFQDPNGFFYVNCEKLISFTQQDIDRSHQQMLERAHKDDMEKLYKRGGDLMQEEEELEAMFENNRSLHAEIGNLQGAIREMTERKQTVPKNLRKEFAQKTSEYKAVINEYKKRKIAYCKENLKLGKEMIETAQKGWHYDKDNPPQNLRSIIFYDHLEDADSDFMDFLAEVLDTGQVVFMRGGEPSSVSFRNSFIFLSLSIAADVFEKILKDEKQVGFHISHPGARLKIIDSIIEEVRKILPVSILDRLRVTIFWELDTVSLMKILDLKIRNLRSQLVQQGAPLKVKFDTQVKQYLVNRANQKKSGAWYLEQDFEEKIAAGLMRILRSGQVSRKDTVLVKLEGEEGKKEIMFYKE